MSPSWAARAGIATTSAKSKAGRIGPLATTASGGPILPGHGEEPERDELVHQLFLFFVFVTHGSDSWDLATSFVACPSSSPLPAGERGRGSPPAAGGDPSIYS